MNTKRKIRAVNITSGLSSIVFGLLLYEKLEGHGAFVPAWVMSGSSLNLLLAVSGAYVLVSGYIIHQLEKREEQ